MLLPFSLFALQAGGKFAAAVGAILCPYTATFQPQDLVNQGKAKAVALLLVGGIRLVKPGEDVVHGAVGNAGAKIPDPEEDLPIPHVQSDPDLPAPGTEFHRIADEIAPHMAHQRLTAKILHRLHIHIELNVLLRPQRFQSHDGLADLLIQRKAALARRDLLVFQLTQKQDTAGEGGKALGIEDDLIHILLLLGCEILAILQERGIPFYGTQRGLEFMGHIGHKVCLQHLHGTQLIGHQIKAVIDLLDLPGVGLGVELCCEISLGYPAHSLPQPLDGAEKQARQQHRHQHTNKKAHYHDVEHQRDIPVGRQPPVHDHTDPPGQQDAAYQFNGNQQHQTEPQAEYRPLFRFLFHSRTAL